MIDDNVVIVGLPSEGLSALAGKFGFPQSDALPSAPAPESKTLLIYRTPWHYLEQRFVEVDLVPSGPAALEIFAKEALLSWRTYHHSMLSQYRKREAACMLINGDRCIDLEALPALIEARLGRRPGVSPDASASGSRRTLGSRASVFRHVVDAIASECTSLYAEMESCAELMGREPEFEVGAADRKGFVLDMLQAALEHASTEKGLAKVKAEKMRDLGALGETLKQQRREIEGHLEHIYKLTGELHGLKEELAKLRSEKSHDLKTLGETLKKQRNAIERNGEHIQQLREELEQKATHLQNLTQRLANDVGSKGTIEENLERLVNDRDSRRALIEQFREEAAVKEREVEALKQENQLSLLQLHQIQEELEHYFKLNQKSERRVSELQQQLQAQPAAQIARGIAWLPRAITGKIGLGKEIAKIKASGLFDEQWYLQRYPDVSQSSRDPIEHYLKFGALEGRNPSARFDTRWYLETYPDVAKAKINPLLHYVRFGKKEGRKPRRFAS